MSARNRYLEFCRKANLKPLPLCQGTLCLFAAFLHQEGLAPKSVSLYLSAVRHMEVEATASSSPRSEWPFLQYVVKRSSTAPGGTGQLPITREIMLWLKQSWCNPGDHLHVLLWATACIAFFGFLRLGEVTAVPNGPPPILMSGVAIDSHSKPTMIKLTLGNLIHLARVPQCTWERQGFSYAQSKQCWAIWQFVPPLSKAPSLSQEMVALFQGSVLFST